MNENNRGSLAMVSVTNLDSNDSTGVALIK